MDSKWIPVILTERWKLSPSLPSESTLITPQISQKKNLSQEIN